MKHFPIFLNLVGRKVLVAGAGQTAVAKLRLILKTSAEVHVFGDEPVQQVLDWAASERIYLHRRELRRSDVRHAQLIYAAQDNEAADERVALIGRDFRVLVNIADNLHGSTFITPAIVDRNPVTVAIGTEGAAPVLARHIKRMLEEALPPSLGVLARLGQTFRAAAAVLPMGRARREFWSRFYFERGPSALARGGERAVRIELRDLLTRSLTAHRPKGRVDLVGAGPGDPELLTLKARNLLHEADVVIHDYRVTGDILELARREAIVVEVGRCEFDQRWPQENINNLMISHAAKGHHVVRLNFGDPAASAQLKDEMDALVSARVDWTIVPGIAASWAHAPNSAIWLEPPVQRSAVPAVTGLEQNIMAKQNWQKMARPDADTPLYANKPVALDAAFDAAYDSGQDLTVAKTRHAR